MSEEHSRLSHDLPEYTPNVPPERREPEATVKVGLGDDYYQGAYFRTEGGFLDYEVPESQLMRWETAKAAYGAVQDEIERVMSEQGNRVLALHMERRKDQPSTVPPALMEAYAGVMLRMLRQPPLLPREGE